MNKLRLLLLPFSLIYWCITSSRNLLFNKGILKSYSIPNKSIVVGNLSVGGTGKTPHTAYLIENAIENSINTSVLSRGYGRKTKGVIIADQSSTSESIGDEPLLYFSRYSSQINVIVAEEREAGVKVIQQQFPANELIILDDAFQHRKVKAGLNILITDYSSPYFEDFILPAGNLRESRTGVNRANIVIVSKCPDDITEEKKLNYKSKINCKNVFFSKYTYGELKQFSGHNVGNAKKVLLVTGIANPSPLLKELKKSYDVELIRFNDHYDFKASDMDEIHKKFDTFAQLQSMIVTTEKDIMRLKKLDEKLFEKYPWYYQPIEVEIEQKTAFNTLINEYVRSN